MADGITMSSPGMNTLIADLGRVEGRAYSQTKAIVERGAVEAKNRMVSDAESSDHFEMASTISYDSGFRPNQIRYEIGPDRARGKKARIANIAYFGGRNGGGGSIDINAGIEQAAPGMVNALVRLAGDLL